MINNNPLSQLLLTLKQHNKLMIFLIILWCIVSSLIIYKQNMTPDSHVGVIRVYSNDYEYENINNILKKFEFEYENFWNKKTVLREEKALDSYTDIPKIKELDPVYALERLFTQLNDPEVILEAINSSDDFDENYKKEINKYHYMKRKIVLRDLFVIQKHFIGDSENLVDESYLLLKYKNKDKKQIEFFLYPLIEAAIKKVNLDYTYKIQSKFQENINIFNEMNTLYKQDINYLNNPSTLENYANNLITCQLAKLKIHKKALQNVEEKGLDLDSLFLFNESNKFTDNSFVEKCHIKIEFDAKTFLFVGNQVLQIKINEINNQLNIYKSADKMFFKDLIVQKLIGNYRKFLKEPDLDHLKKCFIEDRKICDFIPKNPLVLNLLEKYKTIDGFTQLIDYYPATISYWAIENSYFKYIISLFILLVLFFFLYILYFDIRKNTKINNDK